MKGKNKLVPRLLGITKECVMRVDEKTKEVIQEWSLTNIKRWAASPKSFTLVGARIPVGKALGLFKKRKYKGLSPSFRAECVEYDSRTELWDVEVRGGGEALRE